MSHDVIAMVVIFIVILDFAPAVKVFTGSAVTLSCEDAILRVPRKSLVRSVRVEKKGGGNLFFCSPQERIVDGPKFWEYNVVGLAYPLPDPAGVKVTVTMHDLHPSDSGTYSCVVSFSTAGRDGKVKVTRSVASDVLRLEVKGHRMSRNVDKTSSSELRLARATMQADQCPPLYSIPWGSDKCDCDGWEQRTVDGLKCAVCPRFTSLSNRRCLCFDNDVTMDSDTGRCELSCSKDSVADRDRKLCNCTDSSKVFNVYTKKCEKPCPAPKGRPGPNGCICRSGFERLKFDPVAWECVVDCPSGITTLSKDKTDCDCIEKYHVYAMMTNQCVFHCPYPTRRIASLNECECKIREQTYVEKARKCIFPCPAEAPVDPQTALCICRDPRQAFYNKKCVPACPRDAKRPPDTGSDKQCQCISRMKELTQDRLRCKCKANPCQWNEEMDGQCNCVCACPSGQRPSPGSSPGNCTCACVAKEENLVNGTCRVKGHSASSGPCRRRWTYISGAAPTCVRMYREERTWPEARQACRSQDADLVVILTPDHDNFLTEIIGRGQGIGYWIGLNDRLMENSFRWLDRSETARYTNWAPQSPEMAEDQNCVVKGDRGNGSWNDFYCNHTLRFICQRPLESKPGSEDQLLAILFVSFMAGVLSAVCVLMALSVRDRMGIPESSDAEDDVLGGVDRVESDHLAAFNQRVTEGALDIPNDQPSAVDLAFEQERNANASHISPSFKQLFGGRTFGRFNKKQEKNRTA